MNDRRDEEILQFFEKVLKCEIDGVIDFINYDLKDMKDEKQKRYFKDRYSPEICFAVEWMSNLKKEEIISLKTLLKLYSSNAFSYFFKRLEEGENIDMGERINFDLIAVNENTGQKTKLISATPDEDNIDNNFQEWIMDNCSEIK